VEVVGVYRNVKDVLEAGRSFSESIEKINKILNDQSINNTLEELKLYVNALNDLLSKRSNKFNVSIEEDRGVFVFHKYIPDVLLYYKPLPSDQPSELETSKLLDEILNDEEFKKTLAERILSTMALLSMILAESIKKTTNPSL
jgi:hypothetical protein